MERESHTACTDAPLNLPRLALRGGDWQKAAVNEEPPAKRRRLGKLWCWMVAIFLGACGWQMWNVHKYNAAVREAKEAGFIWESNDTISLIRRDWRNALKKETWGELGRQLDMRKGVVPDLGRYRKMLHRLRPTTLIAQGCKEENVDALKGLTALQTLVLIDCPALQNVDTLKGLSGLQVLWLNGCTALQSLDALKGLTGLQTLYLQGCTALQNVDALKGLSDLQMLSLRICTTLQNVDALKGLSGLQRLELYGCDKIPAAALRELRATLPNTDITVPDGTKNPPQ